MLARECDCKEFQDSGHTDECNVHHKTHYNPTLYLTDYKPTQEDIENMNDDDSINGLPTDHPWNKMVASRPTLEEEEE